MHLPQIHKHMLYLLLLNQLDRFPHCKPLQKVYLLKNPQVKHRYITQLQVPWIIRFHTRLGVHINGDQSEERAWLDINPRIWANFSDSPIKLLAST